MAVRARIDLLLSLLLLHPFPSPPPLSFSSSSSSASSSSVHPSLQVVVGDLGMALMADPHVRLQKKFRADDHNDVCTSNYRPPDVTLGSQRYQEDLDMWSFGCVAAELYLKRPLIDPAGTAPYAPSRKEFVDEIVAIVGPPPLWRLGDAIGPNVAAIPASWLEELPFF